MKISFLVKNSHKCTLKSAGSLKKYKDFSSYVKYVSEYILEVHTNDDINYEKIYFYRQKNIKNGKI